MRDQCLHPCWCRWCLLFLLLRLQGILLLCWQQSGHRLHFQCSKSPLEKIQHNLNNSNPIFLLLFAILNIPYSKDEIKKFPNSEIVCECCNLTFTSPHIPMCAISWPVPYVLYIFFVALFCPVLHPISRILCNNLCPMACVLSSRDVVCFCMVLTRPPCAAL